MGTGLPVFLFDLERRANSKICNSVSRHEQTLWRLNSGLNTAY